MSYVFKPFVFSDKSITPFVVHKTISAISGSNNDIKLFKGKFEYGHFDIGDVNNAIVNALPTTIGNNYQYLVHNSIRKLYYCDYSNNQYRVLTENVDKKNLYEYVSCFSIPQTLFGEKLTTNNITIELNVSGVTKQLTDDGLGNLIDSSVSEYFFNLINSGSVAKWDFSDAYIFGSSDISGSYIKDRSGKSNNLQLFDVSIVNSSFGKEASFTKTNSYARAFNSDDINFHNNDDFCIGILLRRPALSTHVNLVETILTKDGIYTKGIKQSKEKLQYQKLDTVYYSSFPFEISLLKNNNDAGKIKFDRFDGVNNFILTSSLAFDDDEEHFFVCQKSGSALQLFCDGVLDAQCIDRAVGQTHNLSDLFIGAKNGLQQKFEGYIKSIDIKERAFDEETILYWSQHILSQSFDYYAGNVFYEQGLVTLTSNSNYFRDFNTYVDSGSIEHYVSWSFLGYGTNTIYEHEYICSVQPSEYNFSLNRTILTNERYNSNEFLPMTSHSVFAPYVTTIGLFNENQELLVVAKLSKPIQRLKKIDQTFIIRFDV